MKTRIPEYMIDHIRQKYPYGLLVSTQLKERDVHPQFIFGTLPRERSFKEWRFKTLDERKQFWGAYVGYVLGEIPVLEAA